MYLNGLCHEVCLKRLLQNLFYTFRKSIVLPYIDAFLRTARQQNEFFLTDKLSSELLLPSLCLSLPDPSAKTKMQLGMMTLKRIMKEKENADDMATLAQERCKMRISAKRE